MTYPMLVQVFLLTSNVAAWIKVKEQSPLLQLKG